MAMEQVFSPWSCITTGIFQFTEYPGLFTAKMYILKRWMETPLGSQNQFCRHTASAQLTGHFMRRRHAQVLPYLRGAH